MNLEHFKAGQELAPKINEAIPDEVERATVYAALAILMASQFTSDEDMDDDKVEKYMFDFARLVCEITKARKLFISTKKGLN